jgi:hypothetical protein
MVAARAAVVAVLGEVRTEVVTAVPLRGITTMSSWQYGMKCVRRTLRVDM